VEAGKQPAIRFSNVDLITLNFSVKGPLPEKITSGISFHVEGHVSDDSRMLDIFVEVDLFGKVPPESRPPIELNFILHGRFTKASEDGMPLDEFAKHHAPAHLVPYARELISNITSRSILPTFNLGPINVIAMIENGDASFELNSVEKKSVEF
jgi:preprotein translocase subunit SecB